MRIERAHRLGVRRARQVATDIMGELAEKYALEHHWDGNTLRFSRTGLNGTVSVSKAAIVLEIELGFMLALLESRIEAEVHAELDRWLGPA